MTITLDEAPNRLLHTWNRTFVSSGKFDNHQGGCRVYQVLQLQFHALLATEFMARNYSFTGVVLVSLSDSKSSQQPSGPASRPSLHQVADRLPHPILGDTLALISALFYALYVILLKVRIRSESRVDMQLFFGFVGLFSVLLCWPVGLVLHLTGGEIFELPRGGKILTGVLINVSRGRY